MRAAVVLTYAAAALIAAAPWVPAVRDLSFVDLARGARDLAASGGTPSLSPVGRDSRSWRAMHFAALVDGRPVRARVCGRSIAFVGEDYRRTLGACADMDGTQVELSAIDGHFEDDELVGLLGSLRVANEKGAQIRVGPRYRTSARRCALTGSRSASVRARRGLRARDRGARIRVDLPAAGWLIAGAC
jgi:hypothetical protein